MDLKSLGYEVRESRIEGILRELKEVISNKDIRFIKMLNQEKQETYININEIIWITDFEKSKDGDVITEIFTKWGGVRALATVDEVLRAIERVRSN